MHSRHLILLIAVAALVLSAFSIGLRAQPGGNVRPRTLDDVDPGIALYPGYGTGGGYTDGFNPIMVISSPGYYYLTQNLDVGSGFSGIHIASGGVHLDLRGFSIRGVSGSGYGVYVVGPLKGNIIIRNGIITQMGAMGIEASYARNALIERIACSANGGSGISLYQGRVFDCISRSNGAHGIAVSQYSSVSGCSADSNGLDGIHTGGGTTVDDCSATSNSTVGISCITGSVTNCLLFNNNGGGINMTAGTIRGCTTNGNSLYGAQASVGTIIEQCTAAGSVTGFSLGAGCVLNRCNTASCSTGISISGPGVRVENNNIRGSSNGVISSVAGSFIYGNTFSGTTTTFGLTGTNFVGTVVSSSASILSSTSPLCNFVQ